MYAMFGAIFEREMMNPLTSCLYIKSYDSCVRFLTLNFGTHYYMYIYLERWFQVAMRLNKRQLFIEIEKVTATTTAADVSDVSQKQIFYERWILNRIR